MSEEERRGNRTTPRSLTLRPARGVRTMPLFGLGLGIVFMATNAVGELAWIAGVILVVFTGVLWLELRSRRVVMTPDALVGHKFFRDRTYPIAEVTLHEDERGTELRHNGDRVLLRLPRDQAKLERMIEPSLSWPVTLEVMESFLGGARKATES